MLKKWIKTTKLFEQLCRYFEVTPINFALDGYIHYSPTGKSCYMELEIPIFLSVVDIIVFKDRYSNDILASEYLNYFEFSGEGKSFVLSNYLNPRHSEECQMSIATHPQGQGILLHSYYDSLTNHGVLTHECVHLTNCILSRLGVKIDPDNDEVQAYLHEYLFTNIKELFDSVAF